MQGTHPFLRRKEPTAPGFLFALFASSLSLLIHFALNGNRGLWSATRLTVGILGCFLGGLCGSIIVYRLSPWHPLADYPGPNLAKCSKWYMAYRVGKGDRHLWLQKYKHPFQWVFVNSNCGGMTISDYMPDTVPGFVSVHPFHISTQPPFTCF